MNQTAHIASQLYTNARAVAQPKPAAGENANVFTQIAGDFMQTLQAGESTAAAAMVGKADASSVVQALAASQIAIETAVSVRDKVVEAYQEILRMPV